LIILLGALAFNWLIGKIEQLDGWMKRRSTKDNQDPPKTPG
jgi:hypothetical protein